MAIKKCLICGKKFSKPYWRSKLSWSKAKFCSVECKYVWWGKTMPKTNTGKHYQTDQNGSKNQNWKGGKVGYHGLHTWINRNFVRPPKCELCDKPDIRKRKFEWANKIHDYTRERNGWLYLCKPCHIKYDIEHNNRPNNFR